MATGVGLGLSCRALRLPSLALFFPAQLMMTHAQVMVNYHPPHDESDPRTARTDNTSPLCGLRPLWPSFEGRSKSPQACCQACRGQARRQAWTTASGRSLQCPQVVSILRGSGVKYVDSRDETASQGFAFQTELRTSTKHLQRSGMLSEVWSDGATATTLWMCME